MANNMPATMIAVVITLITPVVIAVTAHWSLLVIVNSVVVSSKFVLVVASLVEILIVVESSI